ncbi:MAG: hypothetical protein ABTQ32_10370 [Myxococcaceae bacterium]
MSVTEVELQAAIDAASDEVGLPTYYRACVRPIIAAPLERWPRCCGGGCEPCNQTLTEVARRVRERLGARLPTPKS